MSKESAQDEDFWENSCHQCFRRDSDVILQVAPSTSGGMSYTQLFRYLIGSSVEIDPEFPGLICKDCAQDLVSACDFKRKCLENIEYLREKRALSLEIKKEEFVGRVSPKIEEEEEEDDVSEDLEASSELPTCAIKSGFTCDKCGKILSTKGSLTSHLLQHKHAGRYKCSMCQEIFGNFNARKRHINLIHLHRKVHQCPFCEESFQYHETHRKHIWKLHGRKQDVECPKCSKKFFTDEELQQHTPIHDFVPKCEECGKISRDIPALKKHMRNVHKTFKYQPAELLPKPPEKFLQAASSVPKKTFYCEKCQKHFKGSLNLEKHLRTVHREWLCTECGEIIKGKSHSVHMLTHRDNPQSCAECGRTLSSLTALKKHQKRVHGPKVLKKYACSHCDVQFASPHTRRYHIARIHTQTPLYKCHCGQEFLYHHVYKRHIRRDHTGEFPYACDLCPKKFLTLAECRRHKQSHSSERSFQCNTCKKDFKTDVALYIHRKSHRKHKQ